MLRNHFRSYLLLSFVVSALLYGCSAPRPESQAPPNVLMILVDDLNTWVGVLDGHPQTQTPNIDRLAQRGVLFTQAHCQAPICGPSRASMMTGLYPFHTGIYGQIADTAIQLENPITQAATFLPDYFEQQGYKTMGVGKIYHRGDAAKTYEEYGGFSSFGPKPKKRFKYDPEWFDKPKGTQTDWGVYPEQVEEMPDYKIAAWAVDKLQQKHEKPFLLTAGFMRPHVPWYTTQEWFDRFEQDSILPPPYKADDLEDIPEMGKRVTNLPMMPSRDWMIEHGELKAVTEAYLACIASVDHQIGKVLDALEKSEYADNTIIVLASDHGYHLGEKNRYAKQSLWERATHVPMIISAPGKEAGICNSPVGLIDLYPTLLEYCGFPANAQNQGRSLLPLLNNPEQEWPYATLCTYGQFNHTVFYDQWQYIRYEDGSEELYDLANDPNEWYNLALNRDYEAQKEKLRQHLPAENAQEALGSYNRTNEYFRAKTANR